MSKFMHRYEHRTRAKAKIDCKKDFFKLINNSVFRKIMENVMKYSDIRLAATNRERSYLVAEPNYHTKKWFLEKLLAVEINITSKNIQVDVFRVADSRHEHDS